MNNEIYELEKKFMYIKKMNWIKSCHDSYGSIGTMFEQLIGLNSNDLEIPDYNNIEIKVKSDSISNYITLFNATPDSFLFEIKRIVKTYGYLDRKYKLFNVFQTSLYGNQLIKLSNRFIAKLKVDYINKKVVLNILDLNFNLVDNDISWSFELLEEKFKRKMEFLAVINARKKRVNGILYFKYDNISFYKRKDFFIFLRLIESGIIRITFKIGFHTSLENFGKIYDHGTGFEIDRNHLDELFTIIKSYS